MTREEAIEVIEETIDDIVHGRVLDCVLVRVSAFEIAIEALAKDREVDRKIAQNC